MTTWAVCRHTQSRNESFEDIASEVRLALTTEAHIFVGIAREARFGYMRVHIVSFARRRPWESGWPI